MLNAGVLFLGLPTNCAVAVDALLLFVLVIVDCILENFLNNSPSSLSSSVNPETLPDDTSCSCYSSNGTCAYCSLSCLIVLSKSASCVSSSRNEPLILKAVWFIFYLGIGKSLLSTLSLNDILKHSEYCLFKVLLFINITFLLKVICFHSLSLKSRHFYLFPANSFSMCSN